MQNSTINYRRLIFASHSDYVFEAHSQCTRPTILLPDVPRNRIRKNHIILCAKSLVSGGLIFALDRWNKNSANKKRAVSMKTAIYKLPAFSAAIHALMSLMSAVGRPSIQRLGERNLILFFRRSWWRVNHRRSNYERRPTTMLFDGTWERCDSTGVCFRLSVRRIRTTRAPTETRR